MNFSDLSELKAVRMRTEAIHSFYEACADVKPGAIAYRKLLARYYRLLIPKDAAVLEIGCGQGHLLKHLECSRKVGVDFSMRQLNEAGNNVPEGEFHCATGEALPDLGTFDVIIMSDLLNHAADVQCLLVSVLKNANSSTRLLINSYNTLWKPILTLGAAVNIRDQTPESSWLSGKDIENLLELSGWEVIKTFAKILWPLETPVVERLVNRWLAPLMPAICLAIFQVARRRVEACDWNQKFSVSIVVPARNEAGNIEAAVTRTQSMGRWTELIFVEGGSKDETWAEIQRVRAAYPDRRIKAFKQSASGKGNAVREGFAAAEGDLLMILDADLTMPPEELPKFYDAIARNLGEFANGCRLVYPMESRAMRFLNMIANKFFGVSFSWLLGQHVKDTLCGTKVLRKTDYERIASNRAYFGEFDPFGDFDLLFGADKLNLKIVDIPIHYADRTYGTTNIDRWRHGVLLFRMLGFAAMKVKFV